MSTNFYLMTNSKKVRDEYFGYDYQLTDEPDWGYEIHIAKTSCGWLPLFQSHNCFKSIIELKTLYDTGLFKIYDEYGTEYNWEAFDDRVLKFNGGIRGLAPREKIEQDPHSRWYDPNMPEYSPISHFEYGDMLSSEYFNDQEGYEFTKHEFS